jgi:tRNA threonylcarbamoyladenosine biosynthesis protein TsaB
VKLLALDTSSSACSIALSIDGKVSARHTLAPMQQAKIILPLIDELLKSENIEMNQLDAIAFGCGPGSFTGIRIAVSVAQGLAYAIQKPLISVSSLAAIAQAAYEDNDNLKKLLVAQDARINEVYWACYEAQENQLVSLIDKERITRPEEVSAPDTSWCGVGNAWDVYRSEIPFKLAFIDTHYMPTATAILSLAEAKFRQGETVLPQDALPVYLRDDVAKKIADQKK